MKTNSSNQLAPGVSDVVRIAEKHQTGIKNMADQTNRGEITHVEDIPLPSVDSVPVPSPSDEGTRKDAELQDADDPALVLAWMAKAPMEFAPKLGTANIRELENMVSLYLTKVSSCISKCYVPNRAAKMKRCMSDVLMFFSFFYRKISEEHKIGSTYFDQMTHLMAYYIDLEIQASSRAKDNPVVIASKLTSSLFLYLEKSHDHILDSILKANNINRNFWELCSLILSGVLKETPDPILGELTYVRYILVYKTWKRIVQGPEERKRIMALASSRLMHPPQFVEKIRAGLLKGIIPKVPKKRADVTTFLIQAKFDVKEKSKAFLKYVAESKTNILFVPTVPAIKTDIPLLVGYLPDFGPSPKFLKIDLPEPEEKHSHPGKIDLSSSRLINDVWTSVNHEASFREAIRMQNVTLFTSSSLKVKDKKKILRELRQRKVKCNKNASSVHKNQPTAELSGKSRSLDSSVTNACRTKTFCDATIVLSDDSDKAPSDSETGTVPVTTTRGHEKRKEPPLPVFSSRHQPDVKLGGVLSVTATQRQEPLMAAKSQELHNNLATSQQQTQSLATKFLTPSQIKCEMDTDDVIIVSPPSEITEEVGPGSCTDSNTVADRCEVFNVAEREKDVASLKESRQYDDSVKDAATSDFSVVNSCEQLLDVKKEKESPEKEDFTIRINRDLLEKIRCQGDSEKVPSCDGTAAKQVPAGDLVGVPKNPNQLPSNSSSGAALLFDDDESTSSLNGECHGLVQTVVDDFIKRSPTADDNFQPEDHDPNNFSNLTVEVVENPSLVQDASPRQCNFTENSVIPSRSPKTCQPASQSLGCPQVSAQCSPSVGQRYSDEGVVASRQPGFEHSKPTPDVPPGADLNSGVDGRTLVADVHSKDVHSSTLRRDLQTFLLQSEFREMFVARNVPLDMAVPSPIQPNPDTGQPLVRCLCSQCKGNFDALLANYQALVQFRMSFVSLKDPQELSPSQGSNRASTSESLEPKLEDDGLMDQGDEALVGDGGLLSSEPSAQLPFKKRKAFSGSDGNVGEGSMDSPHSDGSREESFFSNSPMMSVADLLWTNPLENQSPSNMEECQVSIEPSTSSRRPSSNCTSTQKPPGGGFAPFTSVGPPLSGFYQELPTARAPETHTRSFRTPAELKGSWEPLPSKSDQYFSKSYRSKKKTSRKSPRVSRKRK